MRTYLSVLMCLFAALMVGSSANAEIYKTVDKDGRVVYTDQPPANSNAKVVELPSINSLPPAEVTSQYSPAETGVADVAYQVTIQNPVSGVVLSADERSFEVSVSLGQSLQPGHMLAYLLDGIVLEKTASTSITVNEPPRGEHKLHVEVMNKYGKNLGQSNAVTVVVMRPIAKVKPVKAPKKH